jgi:hypothetical protein
MTARRGSRRKEGGQLCRKRRGLTAQRTGRIEGEVAQQGGSWGWKIRNQSGLSVIAQLPLLAFYPLRPIFTLSKYGTLNVKAAISLNFIPFVLDCIIIEVYFDHLFSDYHI